MRVLVCGSRDYTDTHKLYDRLDSIHVDHGITEIIHGGAKGADHMAGAWAAYSEVPVRVFPADWQHGRSAGPIRNSQMLHEGHPDLVIAFFSKPDSKGTQNMVDQATRAGVEVRVVM